MVRYEPLTRKHGGNVAPDDIASLHVSRAMSKDELLDAEAQELALYAKRFESFSETRTFVLAAWLFAPIRPSIEGGDDAPHRILNDTYGRFLDRCVVCGLSRRGRHDGARPGFLLAEARADTAHARQHPACARHALEATPLSAVRRGAPGSICTHVLARHSPLGYLSPAAFEERQLLA